LRVVPKPWGREIIFAENELYAGKILEIEAGQCLSLQYHERKDETIYVLEGEMRLNLVEDGRESERVMRAGDACRIRPGVVHRMSAEASRCVLVEASSPELTDVVRLEDRYGRAGTIEP
jgi:quercetin dioxygenase-like cupin family protein